MLINATTQEVLARYLHVADTFLSRGRGLMFRRALAEDEAMLFVEAREGIANTSIHMFFVFFPIAVLWLDNDRRVVDVKLAHPFRPYYAPSHPARYFIEGHPALLNKVQAGHTVQWDPSNLNGGA